MVGRAGAIMMAPRKRQPRPLPTARRKRGYRALILPDIARRRMVNAMASLKPIPAAPLPLPRLTTDAKAPSPKLSLPPEPAVEPWLGILGTLDRP